MRTWGWRGKWEKLGPSSRGEGRGEGTATPVISVGGGDNDSKEKKDEAHSYGDTDCRAVSETLLGR